MINSAIGWFEIMQYDNKRMTLIGNLVVTTWLTMYPISMEILYDQES